ncbi:hypothetical protein A7C99_0843 [Trichophyton rubrum]|uniref:Uncharacterized protein n=1 Tax=Trichophyton rubrum TaxID=5551 RepID=A0A178F5G3_TRIRU|nr:hypothetical protein A7C99_0843 [Trichophyton rubrum]
MSRETPFFECVLGDPTANRRAFEGIIGQTSRPRLRVNGKSAQKVKGKGLLISPYGDLGKREQRPGQAAVGWLTLAAQTLASPALPHACLP